MGIATGLWALLPVGAARSAALEFTATLTVELGPSANPLPNPPPMQFSITGTGLAQVSGSGPASFSLPSGALSGTDARTGITEAGGSPLRTLSLGFPLQNAAGSFSASGGAPGRFGGAMPNVGTGRMVIRPFPLPDQGTFSFPLGATGTSATLVSSTSLFVLGQDVPVTVTVKGGRWRTGPLTVNATFGGANTVTLNGTGVDLRSPSCLGEIQLVSPLHVTSTFGDVGSISPQPGIATLEIRFLPEPVAGLGLLAGAGLLAILGLRRRSR